MNNMKLLQKIYLLLLCLVAMPAYSQWRAGISGGGNYNWYSVDTQYQDDYRYSGAWGWNAAVFTQYDFLPWVGLRAELEASEKSYRFYRTGIYSGTNYRTTNTYLQLPVLAHFSFGGEKVRGFVNAGVYAGYWVAGRHKGTHYNPVSGKSDSINQDYIFNKEKDRRADFGFAGGVGIEYLPDVHWAIHIEGRCYYSMLSTVKQYMLVHDYRYNTTLGINIGAAYLF